MTKTDTQKWKKERAIEIKERHAVGDIITDMEELRFILGTLLNNHPNKKEKIGPGIMHIRIDLNQVKKKAYTIVRVDGTETALGLYKGVGVRKDNVRTASRKSVLDSIFSFRDNRFFNNTYHCDLCKKDLHNKEFDVHHANKEFDEIFGEWRNLDTTRSLDLSMKKESAPHEPPMFNDIKTIESFRSYHDANATLMLLCKQCHYSQKKKKKGDGNNGNTTTTTPA